MDTMVMKQGEAIAWLKKEASNMIDDFTDSSYDSKDVADIIKDLLEDIEVIIKNDWEWVAIEECPMAVSNVGVAEMRRA